MYGASQDITEHKLADKKLLLMKNVVESSVNALAISDLDGYLTYVNPEFLKILNYDSESEVIGMHVSEFWQESENVWDII
ncbi:MAG: PAS domain S-box protein [Methanohalobium sp.]|uniref:PAS domain S-box protein n=1 Tax=Methanohalobium sp. TaxID=2837493 RepID=UPI00397CCBD0